MDRDDYWFAGFLSALVVVAAILAVGITEWAGGREMRKAALLCRLNSGIPVVNYYGELACVESVNLNKGETK